MTEETFEQDEAQEIIEEVAETTEEVADTTPTLEDYERLLKENKTLKAQKEHFKKKATQKGEETNKTNTSGLSREEAMLVLKGFSEEDLAEADKIAKVTGVSLLKAAEDPYLKFKMESRKAEEKAKGAQLGASNGTGATGSKPVSEMTREEHMAYMQKITG